MSTQTAVTVQSTSTVADLDVRVAARTARNMRHGVADATRIFEAYGADSSIDTEEFITTIAAVMDSVEDGPAPHDYKKAFVAHMDDLLATRIGA